MPNFLDQKCGPSEVKDSVLHIEDVALYVLRLLSSSEKEVSSMKLQKICFYIQGWFAAKNGRELFVNDFQAWRLGPVSPRLYKMHAGRAVISLDDNVIQGNVEKICESDKNFISNIVAVYGRYTGLQLSDMSHSQEPWVNARRGVPEGSACKNEITIESMQSYFSKFLG